MCSSESSESSGIANWKLGEICDILEVILNLKSG